jgi:acetyl esterase/lipase
MFIPVAARISAVLTIAANIAVAQTAPTQPSQGPGGTDYQYNSFNKKGPYYPPGFEGQTPYAYYIYQPASPQPFTAPVVLFLHGLGAIETAYYDGWLQHVTQKGYVVVYPQYQDETTVWSDFPINAQLAWIDALRRLAANVSGDLVAPKSISGEVVTVTMGHSVGAFLAVTLAAMATSADSPMPQPLALMLASPAPGNTPLANFGDIPGSTELVMVVGEDDSTVCTSGAEYLWSMLPQIVRKTLLVATTDTYGYPQLVADHYFPTAYQDPLGVQENSQDFYGTYKLSVSLASCAINGTDCEYPFDEGSQKQVNQGNWSDGKPVKDWRYYTDPSKAKVNCVNPV